MATEALAHRDGDSLMINTGQPRMKKLLTAVGIIASFQCFAASNDSGGGNKEMAEYLSGAEHRAWMDACLPSLGAVTCRNVSQFNFGFMQSMNQQRDNPDAAYLAGSPVRFRQIMSKLGTFERAVEYVNYHGPQLDRRYVETLTGILYAHGILKQQ